MLLQATPGRSTTLTSKRTYCPPRAFYLFLLLELTLCTPAARCPCLQVVKPANETAAAALQLLAAVASCSSTASLEQLAQQPQLLAAAVDHATGFHSSSCCSGLTPSAADTASIKQAPVAATRAAAVDLLYHISTAAQARQLLCQLLVQKPSSSSSSSSNTRLAGLWHSCLQCCTMSAVAAEISNASMQQVSRLW
jgi:hypothetical protein